ncbi:MAG TPA: hypothetical protein VK202_02415 [Bacteroidia bacterium]|nr:hypothetical protein [Bacteroidia bacterium]
MTPRLPPLSKITPLRTALLLTTLLSLLLSQNSFAQTDADTTKTPVLVFPSKPFKLFGYNWQANGYNLMAGIHIAQINGDQLTKSMDQAFPSSDLLKKRQADLALGLKIEVIDFSGPDIQVEAGLSCSYELLERTTPRFNKEARLGLFYHGFHNFYYEDELISSPKTDTTSVKYTFNRRASALQLRADMLWNTKPVFKRLSFYGGVGLLAGFTVFDNFSASRSYYSGTDSVFKYDRIDYLLPDKTFPLMLGVYGLGGVKYNAGCYVNIFTEYTVSLYSISHFPGSEVDYSSMWRWGIRMKLNVWDENYNSKSRDNPFY